MTATRAPLAFAVAMALFLAACAPSSHYQPKQPGKAYLVMQQGDLAVYKDGTTATRRSRVAAELLVCSKGAHNLARAADQDAAWADLLLMLAPVAPLVVGPFVDLSIFAPVGGVSMVVMALAIPFDNDSQGEFLDAINMFNDDMSCRKEANHVRSSQD